MIPAEELQLADFAIRFPSRGEIPDVDSLVNEIDHKSILNDCPPGATSCRVYRHEDLKMHCPDPPIYTIPDTGNLKQYRPLKSLQAVFKTVPGTPDCIFSHLYVAPHDIESVLGKDFVSSMKEIQLDIIGGGEFKAFEHLSVSPNRDGSSSYTLAGTVQTKPNILSPVAHSTKLNKDSTQQAITSLNKRLGQLGCEVTHSLFPRQTSRLQYLRQSVIDAPLFGSANNHSFSTAQINISPLKDNESLSKSLGHGAGTHIDRHDDPMSLSLLICLSYLQPETEGGEFILGETREYCALQPFSLLIFRGTAPHAGTQARPSGDQGTDKEKRINIILYPRREFVNRTLDLQWPCYESTRLSDYSFFHEGAACFGTKEYHRAWCSRELFRHFLRDNKRFGQRLDEDHLQQAFQSATGSKSRFVDADSSDGMSILASVARANKLLEGLRPPWQPPRNVRNVPDTSPSESCRGRRYPTTPARPPSQPPADVTNTRITRSRKRMGLETGSQSKHADTPVNGSTARGTDGEESDSVEPDGSDDNTPSPQGLASRLMSTSLFNVSELQKELEMLKSRENLCPWKYRSGHMPRIMNKPDLGYVASGRPLPETSGTILIEELIQMGELCYWINQKNEQMWLFQRASAQRLYTTLLRLERRFDLESLRHLFREPGANTQGAGICSKRLIDAIIEMTELEKSVHSAGETFTFNAKKILGDRYQPKFCRSVEVVMTTHNGRDLEGHRAQHFREVAFRMCFIWSLQKLLYGEGDDGVGQLLKGTETIKYTRTCDGPTKTLQRFLKKLKILRQLSCVFGSNQGFFRVPQLDSFLRQMSRKLSNQDISHLGAVIKGEFKESVDLLDRLGTELSRLYILDSEKSNTGTRTHEIEQIEPLHPGIQEFLRFIEVSAGVPHKLRPDERTYEVYAATNPEGFSPFRDDHHNETYRRTVSSFELQTARDDPAFLARWMIWRLYGEPEFESTLRDWIPGLEEVLKRLPTPQRKSRRSRTGTDRESVMETWNHGIEIWGNWRRERLPVTFAEAQSTIRVGNVLRYAERRDQSAPFALHGDLVRLGIIRTPSEGEMAHLIRRNSDALKGLRLIGFQTSEIETQEALHLLCCCLNKHLDEKAKTRFREGRVDMFDLELALCKVYKKECMGLSSQALASGVVVKKRGGPTQGAGPVNSKKRRSK